MPSSYTHVNLDQIEDAAPRAFEARPDGLELIAFGPHRADGEAVEDDWVS